MTKQQNIILEIKHSSVNEGKSKTIEGTSYSQGHGDPCRS